MKKLLLALSSVSVIALVLVVSGCSDKGDSSTSVEQGGVTSVLCRTPATDGNPDKQNFPGDGWCINPLDIDGDGQPINLDPDIDGDGITNDRDPDVDGDGISNGPDKDCDGDGIPDAFDSQPCGPAGPGGPGKCPADASGTPPNCICDSGTTFNGSICVVDPITPGKLCPIYTTGTTHPDCECINGNDYTEADGYLCAGGPTPPGEGGSCPSGTQSTPQGCQCLNGGIYNPGTQSCVVPICEPGYVFSQGKCVPERPTDTICPADKPHGTPPNNCFACGADEVWDGDACVPDALSCPPEKPWGSYPTCARCEEPNEWDGVACIGPDPGEGEGTDALPLDCSTLPGGRFEAWRNPNQDIVVFVGTYSLVGTDPPGCECKIETCDGILTPNGNVSDPNSCKTWMQQDPLIYNGNHTPPCL
ncbi:MAG: hypothetical protein VW771_11760 [Gammaproteobacteria bacterium]